MALTDTAIRNTKPAEKPIKLNGRTRALPAAQAEWLPLVAV